jgi:hypothetical protein
MEYQMESENKSILPLLSWGFLVGVVVAIFIGFKWGGWTTPGGTQEKTDEALLATRAAICVAQFIKEPNHQEKLNEFKELSSIEIAKAIVKEGWDKMPGEQDAVRNVSRACADGLELLKEK